MIYVFVVLAVALLIALVVAFTGGGGGGTSIPMDNSGGPADPAPKNTQK